MLATLMVGILPNSYAITLNTTDDGFSMAGIFFAKLETLHAKHMSGEIGKVRLGAFQRALGRCFCASRYNQRGRGKEHMLLCKLNPQKE
jgi:hypothetical protein